MKSRGEVRRANRVASSGSSKEEDAKKITTESQAVSTTSCCAEVCAAAFLLSPDKTLIKREFSRLMAKTIVNRKTENAH